MSDLFTFRDVGTCWVIYAPGSVRPWMTLDRYNAHGVNDAGKTRVQEIVDALNAKRAPIDTSAANAALKFVYTLNSATPNDLREALRQMDELVIDMGSAASVRRIAGKVRTLLRYEVKRS